MASLYRYCLKLYAQGPFISNTILQGKPYYTHYLLSELFNKLALNIVVINCIKNYIIYKKIQIIIILKG